MLQIQLHKSYGPFPRGTILSYDPTQKDDQGTYTVTVVSTSPEHKGLEGRVFSGVPVNSFSRALVGVSE